MDKTTFQINNGNANTSMDDEIKNFVNACYIVSPEACCRIMVFQFHERHPGIVRLAVHLENKLRLYFNEQKAFERAINNLHQQHLLHFSSFVKGTISHTTCCIQTYQDFIHGIFQKKKCGTSANEGRNLKERIFMRLK